MLTYGVTISLISMSFYMLWAIHGNATNESRRLSIPVRYGCVVHTYLDNNVPKVKTEDQICSDLAAWESEDTVGKPVETMGHLELDSGWASGQPTLSPPIPTTASSIPAQYENSNSDHGHHRSCILKVLNRNFIFRQQHQRAVDSGIVPCEYGSPTCHLDDNGKLAEHLVIISVSWILTIVILVAAMISDLRAPVRDWLSKKDRPSEESAVHLRLIEHSDPWKSTDLTKSPTLPRRQTLPRPFE